jgi:hypothetical protein
MILADAQPNGARFGSTENVFDTRSFHLSQVCMADFVISFVQ